MNVEIVIFPITHVAVIEHFGAVSLEYHAMNQLIAWRKENKLFDPLKHQCYGIHYTDPSITPEHLHHVDFGISVEEPVLPNRFGIINKIIPELRCAKATDIGSRNNNQAIVYLLNQWLPQSSEQLSNFPPFFHYINVGVNVREDEMITDVYLPLK